MRLLFVVLWLSVVGYLVLCSGILAAKICHLCDCWLPIAGCRLPATDYQLLAAGYWSLDTLNRFSSGLVGLHLFPFMPNTQSLDPPFRWVEILRWVSDTRSDSNGGWGGSPGGSIKKPDCTDRLSPELAKCLSLHRPPSLPILSHNKERALYFSIFLHVRKCPIRCTRYSTVQYVIYIVRASNSKSWHY